MSDTRDIIIYESQEGDTKLEVNLQEETVWLTQEQLSLLFNKDVRTVSEHITNIYEEGELDKKPTIRKFRIVRKEGNRQVKRNIQHYNLDVIISVGYRVKSIEGTRFRKWATNILKQHLIEGYTLNQKRLQEKAEKYEELYPTAEQKAAQLLYFIVKNHSFTDGNKRIAAYIFLLFLEKNGLLYTKEGDKTVADSTLVAITLMIAESNPSDREMIIKVVVHLLQAGESHG